MPIRFPEMRVLVGNLLAFALLLGLLSGFLAGSATAQTPQVIRGQVCTTSGRPLAGAILHLLNLPDSEVTFKQLEQTTVVADASGHFAWTVPTDLQITRFIPTDISLDSTPLDCSVLPIGNGWTARAATKYNWAGALKGMISATSRPAQTHWVKVGDHIELSVVTRDVGEVDLSVQDSQGQPLTNHAVELTMPDRYSDAGIMAYDGRTDETGHLLWQSYPGWQFMQVTVPDVGFGATGYFELKANQKVSVQVPPLCRFATVSGSIPPGLFKPGAYIHIEDSNSGHFSGNLYRWYDPQGPVNKAGHFTLKGILPGTHTLVLVDGKQQSQTQAVVLEPGQYLKNIALAPIEPPKPAPPVPASPRRILPSISSVLFGNVSVSGQVIDATGAPVAGADVYAMCYYSQSSSSIDPLKQILTTQTQADGSYLIKGLRNYNGTVMAVRQGNPPAFAHLYPEKSDLTAPITLKANLRLPSDHPQLTVQVLKEGKPAPGIMVGLKLHDLFSGSDIVPLEYGIPPTLIPWLEPTTITDENGEAHFTDLIPGLWDIKGWEGTLDELKDRRIWDNTLDGNKSTNIMQAVPVRADQPHRVTLNIYPQPRTINFQLQLPDGKSLTPPIVNLDYGHLTPTQRFRAAIINKMGLATYEFEAPGLWTLQSRFRTGPHTSLSSDEPFYESDTTLAISPSIVRSAPLSLDSTEHRPGRLRVKLLDQAGQPVSGSVWSDDSPNTIQYSTQYAASVIAGRDVVFDDMPSGSYLFLTSFEHSLVAPDLGRDTAPFPSDKTLTGVYLLPPQTTTVAAGQETLLTLRPILQGYIRGKVITPDKPENYYLFAPYVSSPPSIATVRYDRATDEFVAGPFSSPEAKITLTRRSPIPSIGLYKEDFSVPISPGNVVHTSLTPHIQSTLKAEAQATSDLLPAPPPVTTVLLPDGKTPAWGALSAHFTPHVWEPQGKSVADAQGHLVPTKATYRRDFPLNPPPGSPTEPVTVAWLPGSYGATIVPSEAATNSPIVLPPAITLRGRITVGEKSINALHSSFRVLAAYQGKGNLNQLLSVEAPVEADGSFELAGLTPGTYQIQATRDDIWLSNTRQIAVGNEPLPDCPLDIAPAGVPVITHLINEQFQPCINQQVKLMRPPGPLTDEIWPLFLTTDKNGDLYIEGLEAGTHLIRFSTPVGEKIVSIQVPPLPDSGIIDKPVETVAHNYSMAEISR